MRELSRLFGDSGAWIPPFVMHKGGGMAVTLTHETVSCNDVSNLLAVVKKVSANGIPMEGLREHLYGEAGLIYTEMMRLSPPGKLGWLRKGLINVSRALKGTDSAEWSLEVVDAGTSQVGAAPARESVAPHTEPDDSDMAHDEPNPRPPPSDARRDEGIDLPPASPRDAQPQAPPSNVPSAVPPEGENSGDAAAQPGGGVSQKRARSPKNDTMANGELPERPSRQARLGGAAAETADRQAAIAHLQKMSEAIISMGRSSSLVRVETALPSAADAGKKLEDACQRVQATLREQDDAKAALDQDKTALTDAHDVVEELRRKLTEAEAQKEVAETAVRRGETQLAKLSVEANRAAEAFTKAKDDADYWETKKGLLGNMERFLETMK